MVSYSGYKRDEESQSDSRVRSGQSTVFYTVTITNLTGDFWDEVSVFYKIVTTQGSVDVVATERSMVSGDSRIFFLGRCTEMASYLVTVFNGPNLIYRFPDTGVMTPSLASEIRPSDTAPCADAWVFEP